MRQQRIASPAIGEIAAPGQRQLRPRRILDRRRHPLLADIGKQGPHTLPRQRLRDRAADAVTGPGHQRRLARGVEGMIEQAHVGGVSVDRHEHAITSHRGSGSRSNK